MSMNVNRNLDHYAKPLSGISSPALSQWAVVMYSVRGYEITGILLPGDTTSAYKPTYIVAIERNHITGEYRERILS